MHKTSKTKIFNNTSSFCPAAFREIYVDSNGRYRLCCHAKGSANDVKKWKEENVTPFEYFLSDEMEEIRNKMYSGEKIDECTVCYDIEKNTGTSYRQRYINAHPSAHDVRDVTLKLRIFGSYCNLGCYMCHPYNSSTRRTEMSDVFGDNADIIFNNQANKFTSEYIPTDYKQYDKVMEDILNHIHLVKQLHMTGGETLQLPRYWKFMDLIPDEHAKNIRVVHDTNLTKLTYKDRNVFEYADKFEELFFNVSADHFGDKHRWIRYPIDQEEFENNLTELSKTGLKYNINPTISILNIDDFDEIFNYYKTKFNPKSISYHVVRGPAFLSIRQLPETLKAEYLEKYKDYPLIVSELKMPRYSDETTLNFRDYCEKLSKHRGFDYKVLWKDFLEKLEYHENQVIAKC